MKKKGFTLIELLVTITILAIVSSIGFSLYGNAQMVGRDGRRKNDLRQIATALELYKQTNGRYPCPPTGGWILSPTTSSNWITDNTFTGVLACDTTKGPLKAPDHISQMPIDPTTNSNLNPTTSSNNKGYAYGFASGLSGGSCPTTIPGNYYVLVTTLENANDKDANSQKAYAYCNNTKIFGDPSVNNNGFAVISP